MKNMSALLAVLIVLVGAQMGWALAPARPGELLVRMRPPIGPGVQEDTHSQAHSTVIRKFPLVNGLVLVKVNPGFSTSSALAVYGSSEEVLYAEPNYLYTASQETATALPNDGYFPRQWALNNLGQTGGTKDADINAPEAWARQFIGSTETVIGIIDTGVDYNHPDLKNQLWTNPGEIPGNGIDDDHNGYIDDVHGINAITGTGNPMDGAGHGTHVAGIIGADTNNRLGVAGVMPKVKMIACKFLSDSGSGDTADAITCLSYFATLHGRQIVKLAATNNSWGGGGLSRALYDAIQSHQQLGILFIAAASNDGSDNDVTPAYPASITLTNIISVASTDHNDKLSGFSNYGRYSVHVAAPGSSILSTFPGGLYQWLSGTSMATPFVTGLAGLIASSDPSLDWIAIKNLIIAGGQPIVGATGKTISGRRIRAFDTNGTGSLSCVNQKVVSRMLPKATTLTMRVGQTLAVQLLSINCKISTRSTTNRVSVSSDVLEAKASSPLNDLGQNGDQVSGDGVYTGSWTPTAAGVYRLAFTGADSVVVTVTP